MGFIIIIIVLVIIYFFYILIDENKSQKRGEPIRNRALEEYTIKTTLFNLYKDYLYDNIKYFQSISDSSAIYDRIEQDFPEYGGGITNSGINQDFLYYQLLRIRDDNKTTLGLSFQIISIAYKNFKEFEHDIYNSGYDRRYCEGGYHSDYGDSITSRVFYIELNRNARLYIGLSNSGSGFSKYIGTPNIEIESNEMYLFTGLRISTDSNYFYPHFEIKNLKKDIPTNDYHAFFNKSKEISSRILIDLNVS